MFKEVEEDLLKRVAMISEPGNNFERALSIAEEYRTAGLTPLFFINEEETMIHVTTEERFYGKYHS